jgi:hypothetical protein
MEKVTEDQKREKLDKIYICMKCSMVFLFKSDVEDHQMFFQHEKMSEIPLN